MSQVPMAPLGGGFGASPFASPILRRFYSWAYLGGGGLSVAASASPSSISLSPLLHWKADNAIPYFGTNASLTHLNTVSAVEDVYNGVTWVGNFNGSTVTSATYLSAIGVSTVTDRPGIYMGSAAGKVFTYFSAVCPSAAITCDQPQMYFIFTASGSDGSRNMGLFDADNKWQITYDTSAASASVNPTFMLNEAGPGSAIFGNLNLPADNTLRTRCLMTIVSLNTTTSTLACYGEWNYGSATGSVVQNLTAIPNHVLSGTTGILSLGAPNPHNFGAGYILHEVIIYPTLLNPSQKAALQKYLFLKYSISTTDQSVNLI